RKECGIRLFERPPAGNDGPSAALGEKLIERQTETSLAAIGRNRCGRIRCRRQGCDGRGADTLCPRFTGKLRRPRFEASCSAPARCCARFVGHAHERDQAYYGDCPKLPTLRHGIPPVGKQKPYLKCKLITLRYFLEAF